MLGLTRLLRGVGFGTAAALLALLIGLGGFVRTAEMKLYDWRVRSTTASREASSGPGVVLVTIDDDSIKRMEPLVGRWPWPRLVHATLIDYLAAGGAKAVVYDVLFAEADRSKFMVGDTEWTGEESDQALVEATARAGNVIHVAEAASAELLDPSKAVGARARRGSCAEPAVHGGRAASSAGRRSRRRFQRWRARPTPSATPSSSTTRTVRFGGWCRSFESDSARRESGVGSRAVKRIASSRHYLSQR